MSAAKITNIYETILATALFIFLLVAVVISGVIALKDYRQMNEKEKMVVYANCIEENFNNPCAQEKCNIETNIDFRMDSETLLFQKYQTCLLENKVELK